MIEMSHDIDANGIEVGSAESVPPQTLNDGAVTQETMNRFPTLTGVSGRTYRAANLLTEMSTRQMNFLSSCIVPVYGLAAQFVGYGIDALQGTELKLDQTEILDALKQVNLSQAFLALAVEGVEMRFLAGLYLPSDDRRFPDLEPEEEFERIIEERIEDLEDVPSEQLIEAFSRFFTSNFAFSRNTCLIFIYDLMKKTRSKVRKMQRDTNPNPGTASSLPIAVSA